MTLWHFHVRSVNIHFGWHYHVWSVNAHFGWHFHGEVSTYTLVDTFMWEMLMYTLVDTFMWEVSTTLWLTFSCVKCHVYFGWHFHVRSVNLQFCLHFYVRNVNLQFGLHLYVSSVNLLWFTHRSQRLGLQGENRNYSPPKCGNIFIYSSKDPKTKIIEQILLHSLITISFSLNLFIKNMD